MKRLIVFTSMVLWLISGCSTEIPTQSSTMTEGEDPLTVYLQERMAQLDPDHSDRQSIVSMIGKPERYMGSEICRVEGKELDLYPQSYWMIYTGDFRIHMQNGSLHYIQVSRPDFTLPNGARIGMTEEELWKIIGRPRFREESSPDGNLRDGVLYEYTQKGIPSGHYEDPRGGTVYLFRSGLLHEVLMQGDRSRDSVRIADIQKALESFDPFSAGLEEVLAAFGEPVSYEDRNSVYRKDSLPDSYLMTYPGVIHILMEEGRLKELRIFEGNYTSSSGFKGGMPLDEVIALAGEPDTIQDGAGFYELESWDANVLYRNIQGEEGHYFWLLKNFSTALWFSGDRIHSIILLGE